MKAEWDYERSCGRSLRLTRNPIRAAWSSPLLSTVKYKTGHPRETYSDTHTHTQAREGQSFEWVTQWETWQRWVCWKTVLPLFAGPLQKRQWSGENLWTSCSSTNVRHILFMSFPLLMYVMNLLYWMHFMISIGLAWLESTGMMTALLQCVKHACFLSTSCSESLNERSIEHGQWLS